MINAILAVLMVAPGIYRGPRPYSVGELQNAIPKVEYILNLESGWYERFHSDPYKFERGHLEYWHITEIDLPISPIWTPSEEELEQAADVIEQKSKLDTIYVHCEEGVDRTGMVIAAWRIRYQHWTAEEAKSEMFKLGFHQSRYFWWPDILKEIKEK